MDCSPESSAQPSHQPASPNGARLAASATPAFPAVGTFLGRSVLWRALTHQKARWKEMMGCKTKAGPSLPAIMPQRRLESMSTFSERKISTPKVNEPKKLFEPSTQA